MSHMKPMSWRDAINFVGSFTAILFILLVCWAAIGVCIGVGIKAAQFVIGL